MKVQPVQVWKEGQNLSADELKMIVVNDNLKDSATFYWELLASGVQVSNGNLQMSAEDYASWGEDEDINESAYEWACGKLGLTPQE